MRTYTYTETKYEQEDYDKAESMEIDEVIDRLENIKRGWLPDYTYDHDGSEEEFERFANQMAMIKALEFLGEYKEYKKAMGG